MKVIKVSVENTASNGYTSRYIPVSSISYFDGAPEGSYLFLTTNNSFKVKETAKELAKLINFGSEDGRQSE
jgi:hypothetical protein